jgi:hypothetical protein
MNNILIVGQSQIIREFVGDYIKENNFAPYEVRFYDEKIKIEQVRSIKKTLSFQQSGKALFVFFNEITVEAQNAMLKSIEEHSDNIYFIFCVENAEELLATIRSRCIIKQISVQITPDKELQELAKSLIETSSWNEVDAMLEYISDKPLDLLVPALRHLMLDSLSHYQYQYTNSYYNFCKKILALLPLVQINNVSKKVIVESAFFN